jgi:hypothetical protein
MQATEPRTITEPPHATPTIHLNGTSARMLREALEDAYTQAGTVVQRLRECRPNGRDYYPQGPTAMAAAVAQADYRENLIHALRESLEAEIGRIDAQTNR